MKEVKNRKFSIILVVVSALFVCVVVFLLSGYWRTIKQQEETLSLKREQLEVVSQRNEELTGYMNEDESSRIVRSARENGYVYPDENVYVVN